MSKRHPIIVKSIQPSPDTSRSIHIPLTELLLIPLMMLCVVSFTFFTPLVSPLHTALTEAKQTPWKSTVHINLAKVYLAMGDYTTAREELNLAEISENNSGVLGLTSEYTEVKDTLEDKTASEKHEFWQKVATDHPEYRDAYVQLLYFEYNTGNIEEAKQYLQKIATLDPNFADTINSQLKL